MSTPIQPESFIRTLLQNSEWPLPFEEISTQVQKLFPEPSPQHIYSPMRAYVDGERVYHPAEKFQSWFTVKVLSPTIIQARFDDGRIVSLAHCETRLNRFAADLLKKSASPEKRIEELLASMPDVQKFGNLYALKTYLEPFPLHRVSTISGLLNYINFCRSITIDEFELSKSVLDETCRQCGLQSLWYIVHIDNLGSILEHGILAKNLVPDGHTSFANEEIQSHRHAIRPDPEYSFTIHDYVPLFFTSKPPLLYKFRQTQEIIKIQISTELLAIPGAIFFDMNARSPRANVYYEPQDLVHLNWGIIFAPSWITGQDPEIDHTNRLYRQAEAGIPLRVIPNYFQRIVVQSYPIADIANSICKITGTNIPVGVSPDFF